MRTKKRILAGLLSLVMVFGMLFGTMSGMTMTVQAATTTTYGFGWRWNINGSSSYDYEAGHSIVSATMSVEAGQSFYIGDLATVSVYQNGSFAKSGKASEFSAFKYSTSNKSVASVNSSSGLVKTVKAGTVNISIKNGNIEGICKVTVVKAGTYGTSASKYKTYKAKAKKLISAYGSGVTTKNCYEVYNAKCAVEMAESSSWKLSCGFRYTGTSVGNKLVLPEQVRVQAISESVSTYLADISATYNTDSSKLMSISSASGKNKTVTIKLKKALTAQQYYSLKTQESDSYITKTGVVRAKVYVRDTTTGHRYAGMAVFKKGSKTATLTLYNLKLKSGRKYMLLYANYYFGTATTVSWTKNVTFKAK